MLKLIIITAALALSVPATANAADDSDPASLCPLIEEFARSVMTARQHNVSMAKLMEAFAAHMPLLRKVAEDMILEAYSTPAYSTPAFRERAIDNFANNWSLACYNNIANNR
ncbi:MAG: hypothetical protein CVT75_09720 [Alphaproteobacteria bacterium HGW-Alphaproteobacteria-14]|nr:MAG: hypothetical protein CVT75_09720 [Alphaproteobacteria bacterium HGW-Alphaproteobacteria-14]